MLTDTIYTLLLLYFFKLCSRGFQNYDIDNAWLLNKLQVFYKQSASRSLPILNISFTW